MCGVTVKVEFALGAGAGGECADVAHGSRFLWENVLAGGLVIGGNLSKTFRIPSPAIPKPGRPRSFVKNASLPALRPCFVKITQLLLFLRLFGRFHAGFHLYLEIIIESLIGPQRVLRSIAALGELGAIIGEP